MDIKTRALKLMQKRKRDRGRRIFMLLDTRQIPVRVTHAPTSVTLRGVGRYRSFKSFITPDAWEQMVAANQAFSIECSVCSTFLDRWPVPDGWEWHHIAGQQGTTYVCPKCANVQTEVIVQGNLTISEVLSEARTILASSQKRVALILKQREQRDAALILDLLMAACGDDSRFKVSYVRSR